MGALMDYNLGVIYYYCCNYSSFDSLLHPLIILCMKVKSESEVVLSCQTLRDLMDCSLPDSSAHGIFQARVLKWVAIAFSRE